MSEKQFTIEFTDITSVNNPNSIHGIYPYRGKISAVDAANIVTQFPKNKTLLDPFCGSGTIIYEAQKHGMTAFGVDSNPLAVDLTKAKAFKINDSIYNETIMQCNEIINKAQNELIKSNFPRMNPQTADLLHYAE